MAFPQVPDTTFTERTGVIEVARVVNKARCIWRETLTHDVGIDGQIEHVANGTATGRIIGAQVKSGPSYFERQTETDVPYSVPEKHRNYWAAYPVPVVLALHDPERELTIWADVQSQLRAGATTVRVPLNQVLDEDGVRRALALVGPLPTEPQAPDQLVADMIQARARNADFDVSFFDLFCLGLTDLAFAVYFGMDLALEIASAKSDGVGLGADEFAFVDAYVTYLLANNLARIDFDAWREAEEQRQMVGTFIAPLTARGRELVRRIAEIDRGLPESPAGYNVVVQETSIGLRYPEPTRRLPRVEYFKATWPDTRP